MPLLKRVERRGALESSAMPDLIQRLPSPPSPADDVNYVNDVHSQLNRTRVRSILRPRSLWALQKIVRQAVEGGERIAVAGGRHAMGGQQFMADGLLLDMSHMNRVVGFDALRGEVEVEAGIEWPELINYLNEAQRGLSSQWSVIQKQTGADRLSLGGALAANIHGRGLTLKPIIDDVESFVLINAEGRAVNCSRDENSELFRLAIGGYGLFGVIAHVRLRLGPRQKLERVVRLIKLRDLTRAFDERIADGYLYGDFQFMTADTSPDFLRLGVFSCYRPAAKDCTVPESHRELSAGDWRQLLELAHTNRERAFQVYSSHYLATDGQLYWSDTHQLSVYLEDYHHELDERANPGARGSEMITELYVPRERLVSFMEEVREDFRANRTELIYGTIRLIEKDDESFLAWARERYSCVVFNLHVSHTPAGIERAKGDFQRLIERAISHGGSYYLTYHRWAERGQVLACYPQLPEFLRLKRRYDPAETFQSEWYRHYRGMFPQDG